MKKICFIFVLALCCAVSLGLMGCDDVSPPDDPDLVGDGNATEFEPEDPALSDAEAPGEPELPAEPEAPEEPESPAEPEPPAEAPAPAGPAPQEHLLKGTFTWDIDGDGKDDLWNHVVDELVQFLEPDSGAQLTRFAGKTFAAVSLSDLQGASYSGNPLSVEGVDDLTVIMEGEVIGLRTSDGKYAKLKVAEFQSFTGSDGIPYPRYNIRFQYVLYS